MLKGYDRIVKPLERSFERSIVNILGKQTKAIVSRFKAYMKEKKDDNKITEEQAEKVAEEITNNIFKPNEGVQTIMTALLPHYINAGELGNKFFNQIHYINEEDGEVLFSILRDDYFEWLEEYGATQIVNINTTTRNITKKIIKDGMYNGDTIDMIADNLINNIGEYTKTRARVIAETEVHNTFSFVNNLTAVKSGFKYKKWVSSRDESVRPNHQKYDSMDMIKIDEEFSPGLKYPGDYNAPPSETVRCRCVLRYEIEKD